MIDPIRELYQEVILDHGRRPRNFGKLPSFTHQREGFNPLCGDKLSLYLNIHDDVIVDVGFEGSGCAISMASASMMSEVMKGKSVVEGEALFESFHQLITECKGDETAREKLGKLCILAGVHEFPGRVKCATLAWHTFDSALVSPETEETITTE